MISWAGMYQGQTNSLEITVYDHDIRRDDFMRRYVPGSDSLEITVYDHDVGRDEFMGRYVPGSNKLSGDHSVQP